MLLNPYLFDRFISDVTLMVLFSFPSWTSLPRLPALPSTLICERRKSSYNAQRWALGLGKVTLTQHHRYTETNLYYMYILVGRGPTIASADSWVLRVYPYLFHCAARFLQCLIDQSDCCVQAEGRSSRRSYLVRLEPDWSRADLSTVTSRAAGACW